MSLPHKFLTASLNPGGIVIGLDHDYIRTGRSKLFGAEINNSLHQLWITVELVAVARQPWREQLGNRLQTRMNPDPLILLTTFTELDHWAYANSVTPDFSHPGKSIECIKRVIE